MARPSIRIHDLSTDEIIDREMNDTEYEQYQLDQAVELAKKTETEARAQAKLDLLSKLGISEEEAQLLLS